MASLASWTSLGTLSWRTTCEVLVGPHQIQSCWPLVPLLTQCSGVSLFMTRRCRPTRGPFCRLWRIVATTRGPCYTHRSMLELFIVPSVPHVRLRNGFSCLGHPIWQRLLLPLFRFVTDVLLLPLWVVGLFPTDTWPLLISSLANALSLMSRWCFPW
jgi:hypothetical protein